MEKLSSTPHQNSFTGLSFLWLELTNRCNLECIHCYTDSSPQSGDKDILTRTDYRRAMDEGASAGCRQIQFIGGEPTLNRDLPDLISYASDIGYSYIEVYSNLIRLPSELLDVVRRTSARFATSVYSSDAAVHDAVTRRSGSHARTMSNLTRLIKSGIPVRASFIETAANADHWKRTEVFLRDIGVDYVAYDMVRGFGRGGPGSGECDAGELCGRCWDERLCVGPDGSVSPCIMSKAWGLGNVRESSVKQIAFSSDTAKTRSWLHSNRGARIEASCPPTDPPGICGPDECHPGPGGCPPYKGACAPELSKEKRFCVPAEEQTRCAPELSKEKRFCVPAEEL